MDRNEYMRMYYRKRKSLGLCKICGAKTEDKRVLCPFCVEHSNALRRIRKEEKRKNVA